jgi:hypothetical protein
MEIPFTIEDNMAVVGNTRLALKNNDSNYQFKRYNAILASNLVSESLNDNLYMHQLLTSRYLFHQDSLLIMHEPGTGKTETCQNCAIRLLEAGFVRKILIVNTSDPHNTKAKRTFGALWNMGQQGERFKHLTAEAFIKQYVQFNTYSKLTTILNEQTSDMSDLFNYTCVIFDEAHYAISEDTKRQRYIASAKLVDCLSVAKGVKIILSTATPIMNEATSFRTIESILLRTNNIPKTNNSDLSIPGELVSYKGANYDYLNVIQMYNPLDPLQGRLIDNNGNPLQTGIAEIDNLRVYRVRPKRCQMASLLEHLVSVDHQNFLTAFDQYCVSSNPTKVSNKPTHNVHNNGIGVPPENETESSTASSFSGSKQVIDSCIVEEIIQRINESKDGIVIIYLSLRELGAKVIIDLLVQNGFEPYTGISSDKRTFLFYDSNATAKQEKLFLDAKKAENCNGDIVKVIIGSRAMRDGIDIFHATQIHIVLPEWHIPGMKQAQYRGIRSSGHNSLLHHRATELSKTENITLDEAYKRTKINYQVFNYIIDLDDLTDKEIDEARNYFQVESKKDFPNDEIRAMVSSRNPALRKIEIGIQKYSQVGQLYAKLKRESIDYHINSGFTSNETTPQRQLITNDTNNYFFSSLMSFICQREIVNLISEQFRLELTELVRMVQNKKPLLTESEIICCLYELTRNNYLVFVPKLGHQMRLNIGNGLVYLVSYISLAEITPSQFSNTTRVCIREQLTFHTPDIQEDDLVIVPTRKVDTINKLKKTLLEATRDASNRTNFDPLGLRFLRHMTNFWGFELKSLTPNSNDQELNVYIFGKHVLRCSIHVRQRIKGVITLIKGHNADGDEIIEDWTQTKSSFSQQVEIIRPIDLIERYEQYNFREITQIREIVDMRKYHTRTNGIIMIKGLPLSEEPVYMQNPPNYKAFVEVFVDSIVNMRGLEYKLVSLKKFSDLRSKGRQFPPEADIRTRLIDELCSGIYHLFFPYHDSNLQENVSNANDTNLLEWLLEMKRQELANKQLAESGTPSWRNRLLIIEFLYHSGQIDELQRGVIYRNIWKKAT